MISCRQISSLYCCLRLRLKCLTKYSVGSKPGNNNILCLGQPGPYVTSLSMTVHCCYCKTTTPNVVTTSTQPEVPTDKLIWLSLTPVFEVQSCLGHVQEHLIKAKMPSVHNVHADGIGIFAPGEICHIVDEQVNICSVSLPVGWRLK